MTYEYKYATITGCMRKILNTTQPYLSDKLIKICNLNRKFDSSLYSVTIDVGKCKCWVILNYLKVLG